MTYEDFKKKCLDEIEDETWRETIKEGFLAGEKVYHKGVLMQQDEA